MEFFEFLTVAMVCVGLPAIILHQIRKIKEAKYLSQGDRQGSALRTSELEVIIEDAVRRAVRPLASRIDELEGVGEPARLPETPSSPLLSDDFAEFDDEEELAPMGRSRVRS